MSIPTSETIFGTIEFQNNTYELLSQPLSDEQFEKINQYKKDNNCSISSAPWSVNKYKWRVENDKIYLIDIQFKLCENKLNHIENIFDTNKLLASWVNRELKLLVLKEDIDNQKVKREVIFLDVQKGVIKNCKNITEEYNIPRLRLYIS